MNHSLWVVFLLTIALGHGTAFADLQFKQERIGTGTYEAASVFDVDRDGVFDIVSGEYWYPGPSFAAAQKICDIMANGDYFDDFSNNPMDVNGDGYDDIVFGGWWGKSMGWRENPGKKDVEWTNHVVAEVGNVERNCFYDIDGDGYDEVFSQTKPVHFFRLIRDKDGKGTGKFEHYTINTGGGGHGFGAGDLNGDGRMDLVFAGGWLEAPEDPFDVEAWKWHGVFDFGQASVPIIVYDVNKDGLNDLIVGAAHGYGLWWYEQQKNSDGEQTWTEHVIEEDRSQFHEMQLADLDNDGEPELITGKRYRAHSGNDPGANDPLGLYYYTIDEGAFERHTVSYGKPGMASGTGIYLWIADIDGNGWKDIVAPGKEGLYLFRNMGKLQEK